MLSEECMRGLGIRDMFCEMTWEMIRENFAAMYQRFYREEDQRAALFTIERNGEMEC